MKFSKYSITLLLLSSLLGCSAPKEYPYKGRLVTKKKYDRVVARITRQFIRESSDEMNRLFMGVEVRFDTSGLKTDSTMKIDTVNRHYKVD